MKTHDNVRAYTYDRSAEIRREADEFMAAFDAIREDPGLATLIPNSEPGDAILVTSRNVDEMEARVILADLGVYPELLQRVVSDPVRTDAFLSHLQGSFYTDAAKHDIVVQLQALQK